MTALRFPWDFQPAIVEPLPPMPDALRAPKRRGRRPAATPDPASSSEPAWRYHHLTITGPSAELEDFTVAARGAGVIPWQFDTATMEEDVSNLAASQPPLLRSLSIDGCRLLARQLRDRLEARAAKSIRLSETSKACPFDLHKLLPVPEAILRLGPSAAEAVAWLEKHWGISGRLHQVAARPDAKPGRRLRKDEACLGFGFFAWAATPRPAMTQIAARWPDLRFALQALPAD
jgi:hypothetical protein